MIGLDYIFSLSERISKECNQGISVRVLGKRAWFHIEGSNREYKILHDRYIDISCLERIYPQVLLKVKELISRAS